MATYKYEPMIKIICPLLPYSGSTLGVKVHEYIEYNRVCLAGDTTRREQNCNIANLPGEGGGGGLNYEVLGLASPSSRRPLRTSPEKPC